MHTNLIKALQYSTCKDFVDSITDDNVSVFSDYLFRVYRKRFFIKDGGASVFRVFGDGSLTRDVELAFRLAICFKSNNVFKLMINLLRDGDVHNRLSHSYVINLIKYAVSYDNFDAFVGIYSLICSIRGISSHSRFISFGIKEYFRMWHSSDKCKFIKFILHFDMSAEDREFYSKKLRIGIV